MIEIFNFVVMSKKELDEMRGLNYPTDIETSDFKSMNEYMKGHLRWNVHLLDDYISEMCDWSREFPDGKQVVYKSKFDACLYSLEHIKNELYRNYNPNTKIKCRFCDMEFTGYFAGERVSHHEAKEHEKEVQMLCFFTSVALINMMTSLLETPIEKNIKDFANYENWGAECE